MNKQLKSLVRTAEQAGWTWKATTRGHLQFIPPDKGKSIVTVSGTPSDHRAWQRVRSDFRHSGLSVA